MLSESIVIKVAFILAACFSFESSLVSLDSAGALGAVVSLTPSQSYLHKAITVVYSVSASTTTTEFLPLFSKVVCLCWPNQRGGCRSQ